MKAVIYTQYGPPEVLQPADVAKPVPGDGDVLVRVRATAVTTGDMNARGFTFVPPGFGPVPRLMFGWKAPRQQILGADFAGEVEVVGKDVAEFRPGEKVFGTTGAKFGAYAEYVCMPVTGVLATMPDGLSFEEAAGSFFGAHTALYFLRDRGNIREGQSVLVNGASGGVGTFAVQLAKHFGAQVTGVCSGASADLVRSLGAEDVIDYTKEDVIAGSRRFDLVVDTRGNIPFSAAKRILMPKGILLAVSSGPLGLFRMLLSAMTGGKKLAWGVAVERKEDLLFLRDLLASGTVKTVIDRTYTLDQIVEAHRRVDTGHKKGSVVVTVA